MLIGLINIEPKIINTAYMQISQDQLMCYVLIGFNTTEDADLYRIEKLRELDIMPFVMPFDKHDDYQKRISRYVNNKAVFKTTKWKDYK